jgi:hypothetical protein
VSGQLHGPGALPPGKEPPVTCVGPRSGLDEVRKTKNSSPHRESNPGHLARIPALSWAVRTTVATHHSRTDLLQADVTTILSPIRRSWCHCFHYGKLNVRPSFALSQRWKCADWYLWWTEQDTVVVSLKTLSQHSLEWLRKRSEKDDVIRGDQVLLQCKQTKLGTR